MRRGPAQCADVLDAARRLPYLVINRKTLEEAPTDMKTRITEMFGVETPIVMGGMTGVGYGELVAAVANAGALGFITAHMFQVGPRRCSTRSRRPRALTDKPFGVNLTLLPSINPIPYDEYREAIIAFGHQDRRDRRARARPTTCRASRSTASR